MYLASLLIVPLLICLGGLVFSKGRLTLKEFFALEGVIVLVLLTGYSISRWQAIYDTEIVSGKVVKKAKNMVSCEHSYSCNCTTDSKGNRSCSTCYEHSHDWDWDVYTNAMNKVFTIDRIDRQGNRMPPRWGAAYINEPVAVEHGYTNYLLAHPDSVLRRFNLDLSKYQVPKYPDSTFDYYRLNRFISVGYVEKYSKDWNWWLAEIAGELGPRKQVEPVVVAVKSNDVNYEYAIEQKWIGGKKNDLIVLLGVPEYPKISWARVISWSNREDLKVELRDSILKIGSMDQRDLILASINQNISSKFERMHMSNYKYLMAQYQPSTGYTVFLYLLGLALSIGGTWYFIVKDPFGESPKRYYRRYSYV